MIKEKYKTEEYKKAKEKMMLDYGLDVEMHIWRCYGVVFIGDNKNQDDQWMSIWNR